jgi:hypothetical protein
MLLMKADIVVAQVVIVVGLHVEEGCLCTQIYPKSSEIWPAKKYVRVGACTPGFICWKKNEGFLMTTMNIHLPSSQAWDKGIQFEKARINRLRTIMPGSFT